MTPDVQCDVVTWQLFGLSLAAYNAIFSFLIAGLGGFALLKAAKMPRKAKPKAPGADASIEAMIRVDHAGEYGAVRIYEGQLAVLKGRASADTIRHMAEQEQRI